MYYWSKKMKYSLITLKGILEDNKDIEIASYGTLDLYKLNEELDILYDGLTTKPAIYVNYHPTLLNNQFEIRTSLKKDELTNYILSHLGEERDIEIGLFNNIYNNSPIDSLMEYMNRYLKNPIILYDRAFHVLAYTKKDIIDHHFWKDIVLAGGVEELNEEANPGFLSFSQSLDQYSLPTFVSDGNLLSPFVISNIYYKNKRISSMCVAEYHHKITSLDLSRIFHFSKMLTFELQKSLTIPNTDLEQQLLMELMDGKQFSPQQIASRLQKISFIPRSHFKLYCIDNKIEEYTFLMIKHSLKKLLGCDYIFCNIDKLYMLVSFDKEEQIEKINCQLSSLLGEIKGKIYITSTFWSINDISKFFKQIEIIRKHSINQITTFDEIALDYVVSNLIDNCGIDNVVPNSIRILHENDIMYKTEYCKTLLTYLNKHFNQRETAQALHINRSSLIYRLEKIKNNFNLDICNEKDYLLLHLGLIMLMHDDI